MGFTDVTFLFVFLPISILIYLIADRLFHSIKLNNMILVVLSFVFYLWVDKEAAAIVFGIVVFDYTAGKMLENSRTANANDNSVWFPIVVIVGVLVFYKYSSLLVRWANSLIDRNIFKVGNHIVPIGISFIIFESVSYLIDIYRGDAMSGSFLDCMTFFSLFPKIVSGPIVLWKDFYPQLAERSSTEEAISKGIDRIIVGYAKKSIIADSFGTHISLINNAVAIDAPTMWIKAVLYFSRYILIFQDTLI